MRTTAKDRVKMLGIGDPTKPKNARKVDKVPDGYLPMKGLPNYYYKHTGSGTTSNRATSEPKMSNEAWSKYIKLPEYLAKKAASDDFVYIEPTQPTVVTPKSVAPKPEEAFRGEPILVPTNGGISNKLIGYLDSKIKSTKNIAETEGMTNTGQEDGIFMYAYPENSPNYGKPDASKGKYRLSSQVRQQLMGTTRMFKNGDVDLSPYKIKDEDEGTVKMAMGGEAWAGIAQQIPGLAEILTQITSGTQAYSKQPIVNASTVRNMATPYSSMAMGGTIDDLDEDELASLQQMADEQGITLEEAFEQTQQDDVDEEYDEEIPDNEETEQEEFAMGGRTGRKVEIEGQEVVETPDGRLGKVKGPSHENGGVDAILPEGSEVFSKRLKIEGKSMAARKINREKRISKVQSLLKSNPHSVLLKNTVSRTMENLENEDRQDMTLQKIANQIYAPPSTKSGTREQPVDNTNSQSKRMAFGGETPFSRYANRLNNIGGYDVDIPFAPIALGNPIGENPIMADPTTPIKLSTMPRYSGPTSLPSVNEPKGESLTPGDYIGMAGSIFGSVAPLVNTLNNRKDTLPNINRFKGFGHDAIAANDTAQDYIAGIESDELSDIDTSANSSYTRNNNSASSINTVRALDAITNMGRDKAKSVARNNASRNMMNLLGQRGQLTNMRDFREMSGDKQVDTENKMDIDNFYSNLGQNLSGIGTGIQTIGRDLNVAHGNKVDANLISQLSRYGLAFDEDGNIVNKK